MNTTAACDDFPFQFFASNGTAIRGEIGSEGYCIFPDANCGLDSSIEDCCQAKDGLAETGSEYMYIAFAFIFLPYIYLNRFADWEDTGSPYEERDSSGLPPWVKKVPGLSCIFSLGLWVSITLQIMVPIFMKGSIQAKLDVSSRNALIAGEAFIVPYKEIFQFIEDIVLVRVNYAMARGQKERTNQLVHAGIAGTLFTGLVAAVFGESWRWRLGWRFSVPER